MSLNLTAYLNQRFQWSYQAQAWAALYPAAIAAAVWRLQVRPFAGSSVVLLDFKTGGSPQGAAQTATWQSSGSIVVFKAPTSALRRIAAGSYYFDFGFVLPGADFERVDGGTIKFDPGVTLAGVAGTPAAPAGGDDTVTGGANPSPSPIPTTLDSAISAANSAAAAVAADASAAAASAASAADDATRAATSAAAAATSAADAARAATASAATQFFALENLAISAPNTLPALSHAYSGGLAILFVNGQAFFNVGANPAVSISGSTVTWSAANAGLSLATTDNVAILYSR